MIIKRTRTSRPVIHPGYEAKKTKHLILYKYISPTALSGLIQHGDFRITFRQDANDPLELLPKGELPDNKVHMSNEDLGFISLTKNNNCPPLWGNYADKYQGACVRFDFDYYFCNPKKINRDKSFEERMALDGITIKGWGLNTYYFQHVVKDDRRSVRTRGDIILKCVYKDDRSLKELVKNNGLGSREKLLYRFTRDWLIIATKHKSWSYEEEYRLPVVRSDSTRSDFQIPTMYFSNCLTRYITKIILGPKCPLTPQDVNNMIAARRKSAAYRQNYLKEDLNIVKAQFKKDNYLLKIPRSASNSR